MPSKSRAKRVTGLGVAIIRRREELGYRRKDLAETAQLSYPYLSEIENGTKNPSGEAFDAIAAALDLAPQELRDLEKHYEVVEPAELEELVGDVFTPAQVQPAYVPDVPASQAPASDLVEALTADVLRQIEPIVRAAIARALREQA
jgi:transcriptional regulator with XRE-family HTH domain